MWCIYISLIALLFYGAWWTYGLHTRYMRLVVKVLEQNSEGNVEASKSSQTQEEIKPDASTDKEDQSVDQSPAFVDTATKHILNNISDSEFTIDRLCREMAMSRTMFYVKLKSLTGK